MLNTESFCSLCGKDAVVDCFDLKMQPLANKYPASEQDKLEEFMQQMKARFCKSCRSIHLPSDQPRSVFFEDYYYLSSVNSELVRHFEKLAKKLKNRKFVVDVGSNDGILLRPLKKLGVRAIGVDPSQNVGALANAEGLETMISFFDQDTSRQIAEKYGKPDCIVASSVFTHMEDPTAFLNLAGDLISDDGVIIVEVEYIAEIIKTISFERFYFDRPYYFSLSSVMKMAEQGDLTVFDVAMVDVHGGSIQLHLCKSSNSLEPSDRITNMLKQEAAILTMETIQKQFNQFEEAIANFKQQIAEIKDSGKSVFGYGCPARLSTITNFGNIDRNLIEAVIEDSSLKAGRFSPGKHIPIISSNDIQKQVDIFVVFAFEYIDSIKAKTKSMKCEYFKPVPFQKI
jgi:methylation protein EvaC